MKLRYIGIIIVVVGLIGCLILGTSYKNRNEGIMRTSDASHEFQLLCSSLSSKMQDTISEVTDNLTGAADALAGLGTSDEGGSEKNVFLLLDRLREKLGLQDILYCDNQGNAKSSDGTKYDVAFCPYYSRALISNTTITKSGFTSEEDEQFMWNVPVISNGEVIGVIRASAPESLLKKNMTISNYRGREKILMLDRSGVPLITTAGVDLKGYKTILDIFEKDSDAKSRLDTIIRQGRTFFSEVDEELTTETFGGQPYYMAYQGITGSSEWGIMLILDEETLLTFYEYDKVGGYNTVAIVLAVICIVLALGLGVYAYYETHRSNRMFNLAYYDKMAGTMNSNFFRQKASAALQRAGNATQYAVVQMGIAKYEYLKDFFGEDEISRMLQDISQILDAGVKRNEYYCHNFGEEYDMLLAYHSEQELKDRLKFMATELEAVNRQTGANDKYTLAFRFGVACAEKKVNDYDTLMRRAGLAYLSAKTNSFSNVEFYTTKMESQAMDEKEIENDMYDALENREFLVYLQPKFDVKTGLQNGAESLIRWQHPTKKLMMPGRFIGTFEKNGFIVKLDMYMLEELCRRIKVWMSKGYRPMPLSLNISQQNLFDPDFVKKAAAIAENYGVPAHLIIFEMSERVVADNMEILKGIMADMQEHGFRVSMDNFGTASTSMNTLYNVPVDELKIDRKFLLNAEKTDRGQNVIQSIVEMAKRLQIDVVAEGVENKQQAMMLRTAGCDMIQGFAFSEPLPEREYEEYAYGARARENSIW